MKSCARVTLDNQSYYLVLNDLKGSQTWFLYSIVHPMNLVNLWDDSNKDNYPDLTYEMLTSRNVTEYLVESLTRSKKTAKTQVYKGCYRINKIISEYLDARDYSYEESAILENSISYEPLKSRKVSKFSKSNEYSIDFFEYDSMLKRLSFRTPFLEVDLKEMTGFKSPRRLEYVELQNNKKNLIDLVSVEQVNYERLDSLIDLSWYKGKKDYRFLTTIEEFESQCMTPMIRTMAKEIAQGKRPLISCDTETSGLNVYYLSDDNPMKDRITTIQFAWKDNQGVLVGLDMKYFDNIPKDYVFNRVRDLFNYWYKKPTVNVELFYDENGTKLEKPESYCFKRKSYDLTGHNTVFDSRVTLSENSQFYFDHDTLQMAFNLNPITVKKDKGLKKLTRYFFNEETPELTDILGKGNEGKFAYLRDPEVIKIYGCADVDYSRKLFYNLKELMDKISPKMFEKYSKLDPISWYVAAQSEYYGLMTDQKLIHENSIYIKKDLDNLEGLIYKYVGSVLESKSKLENRVGLLATNESLEISKEEEDIIKNSLPYRFKLSGNEVRDVMYKLLKYPVLVWTKGDDRKPAVNKVAIEKLLKKKLKKPSNIMKKSLYTSNPASNEIIVDAEKFNSYKYPLCYLLQQYSKLNKEYTTYYKPFEVGSFEGRLFKPIRLTNIETRRWSCACQIIKKSVKKAIIPTFPDYYRADWDLAQVENRIFTSIAEDEEGIKKLMSPESDSHTENAALMFDLKPYLVPKDLRSHSKQFNFGIPYGLSLYSLEERLFRKHSEETAMQTRILEAKFERANKKAMDFLRNVRSQAIKPVEVPKEIKKFWKLDEDAIVGMVFNNNGFYRYFDLTNVLGDSKKEAAVMRAAGNYPIQSYAADMYRLLVQRFYNKLIDYKIEDKVQLDMYIHDEVLFSVHKSVDPRLICKICAEACMIRIKNHTNYFIGLGFGNDWYTAKSDSHETPAKCLLEIRDSLKEEDLVDWVDDPNDIMMPLITNYKMRRILDCIEEYRDNNKPLNFINISNNFKNYMVRSYVLEQKHSYKPKINEFTDKTDSLDEFKSKCLSVYLSKGLENELMLDDDGTSIITIKDYVDRRTSEETLVATNTEELLEVEEVDNLDSEVYSEFYSFDDEEDDELSYLIEAFTDEEEDEPLEKPETYSYVKPAGTKYIVNCGRKRNMDKVVEFLSPRYSPTGEGIKLVLESTIETKILRGSYLIKPIELDDYIKEVRGVKVCQN